MTPDDMTQLLVDIKTQLAVIEAKQDRLWLDMIEHDKKAALTRAELDKVQSEMDQARGSLKILQWLVGSGALTAVALFIFR